MDGVSSGVDWIEVGQVGWWRSAVVIPPEVC